MTQSCHIGLFGGLKVFYTGQLFTGFGKGMVFCFIVCVSSCASSCPQNRLYGVDATLENKKDPDAVWGFSKTKGWVNGFKIHVLSDLKLGLPIKVLVTPANKHDSPMLSPLVRGIGLGDYVMDAGYDSEPNHQEIAQEGGFPAIC